MCDRSISLQARGKAAVNYSIAFVSRHLSLQAAETNIF